MGIVKVHSANQHQRSSYRRRNLRKTASVNVIRINHNPSRTMHSVSTPNHTEQEITNDASTKEIIVLTPTSDRRLVWSKEVRLRPPPAQHPLLPLALQQQRRLAATTTTSTSTTTTTTTITTTSATTTTTTTTPMPPCTPVSVSSSSNLLSATSGGSSYTCYAYAWTPLTTGIVTLTFSLQHNPAYWFLDDVSVYNGGTQMLTNGGFESGSFSPGWTKAAPTGCGSGTTGYVSSTYHRTGSYGYADGCNSHTDQLSQSFVVTAGQPYIISFWLKSGGTGSGISISVDIS
ncbi:unnamed protein product [Adineta steineri]|uniref:Uncharacterized protein n=3 Tax=Adineta steineri TaxID=433720 RepID=A0A815PDB2_9BILA|nr:unnamed protein product [Adineta steineri]CAF3690274.1 unnamed protein product [Adineta steineri]